MEIKIKMSKDTITKDIPENLISEYTHLGWQRVIEKNENKSSLKDEKSLRFKD